MNRAVVVLPTYNEKDNIVALLQAVLKQQKFISTHELHVLVVDDSSPDGTGFIVKKISQLTPRVHLITGKKQGLGKAYLRGFRHAIYDLKADVVFEMDADFSHNPADLPRLLAKITLGADFVIGSRYVTGGSIPGKWSFMRRLNSKFGNMVARHIAGLNTVQDCTGGFRAIRTSLLKKINLRNLKVEGYAFQMSLLHQALKKHAIVHEIPIAFTDRIHGESKIRMKDIYEFIISAFVIRYPFLQFIPLAVVSFVMGMIAAAIFINREHFSLVAHYDLVSIFIVSLSLFMTIQGIFTIIWMIYAWEDPKRVEKNKSPKKFLDPRLSFTALIPARNEEFVIKDTIDAVSKINYPEHLKEALIICRSDDPRTIRTVQAAIDASGKTNIKLCIFHDFPVNKPHSLNVGLEQATKDVIVVFDAEDEPHKDIYHIVNTIMLQKKSDVVQSGVQLMNFKSRWFSTLNVLEYFFWFKSALHLFSRIGTVPLGGNTVFFKKKVLEKIGGWNEHFLTEDADIGIRLSGIGAKIDITYDEQHVTREETPASVGEFIRQRTRWDQGFLQVFLEGDWLSFPKLRQKLLSFYILLWPFVQAMLLLYLPFSLLMMFTVKLPIIVDIVAFIPVYLILLQMLIYMIGLREFTRDYGMKFPVIAPIIILLTFYPYQIILGISALRAIYRLLTNSYAWEKTLHVNAHRQNRLGVSV